MRRARRRPTREQLQQHAGYVRLADLAGLVPFSRQKLLADAYAGRVRVAWLPCGRRRMAMVESAEAVRYIDSMTVPQSARDDVPRSTMA